MDETQCSKVKSIPENTEQRGTRQSSSHVDATPLNLLYPYIPIRYMHTTRALETLSINLDPSPWFFDIFLPCFRECNQFCSFQLIVSSFNLSLSSHILDMKDGVGTPCFPWGRYTMRVSAWMKRGTKDRETGLTTR